jgi:ABC-2 type transport system permease protein
MAEIGFVPSVGQQMILIFTLRWQLFRNSLRTLWGRLEAAALAVIVLLWGFLALGPGVIFALGAFAAVRHQRLDLLLALMWAVFLFWQLFPLFGLIFPFTGGFDFATLLRFPLRFSTFFLLSITYGLCEPVTIVAVFWLAYITAGIAAAQVGMLWWTGVVLAVFGAVNVLLSRVVLSWLERWTAQRRGPEALFMVGMLMAMGVPLLGLMAGRRASRISHLGPVLQSVVHLLPPGWSGRALAAAATGNSMQAASALAILTAVGLIFAWLLIIRLRAQYRGQDLGETPTVIVTSRERVGGPGWHWGKLSGPVPAVLDKEVRYFLRNGLRLLSLLSALIFPVYFGLSARVPHGYFSFLTPQPDLIFPMTAALSVMGQTNWAYNSFGFDGPGVQLFLVAPITFRDVMIAKSLADSLASLAGVGLAWVGVSLLFGPPGRGVVVPTLAGLLFLLFMNLAAANVLSLWFPRRLEFGSFRGQRTSWVNAVAYLAINVFLLGTALAIFLVARHAGQLWLATVLFLILCAPAALAYGATLNLSNRIALNRRAILLAELCR